MAMRLRIKYKILFSVLSVAGVIYIASVGYIVSTARRTMIHDSYTNVRLSAERTAFEVSAHFEQYMSMSLSLAEAFSSFADKPLEQWLPDHLEMMRRVYEIHPDLISLWDSYEFSAFRPDYKKAYGRLSRSFFRHSDGRVDTSNMVLSMTGDSYQYADFKAKNTPSIWEPYLDITSTNLANQVLMTTVAAPIRKDGKYAGLVACDIALDWLQKLVFALRPYEGSTAFLVSYEGVIAAYPQDSMLMRPIEYLFPTATKRESLREAVKAGRAHSFIAMHAGEQAYIAMAPIKLHNTDIHWSLGIQVPLRVINASADTSLRIGVVVGLVAFLILALLLINISNRISRPIERVTATLRRLGAGELSPDLKLHVTTRNEIEEMAKALNALIEGLGTKRFLADRIGRGDLSQDITLLSDKDALGHALITMRNSLREAQAAQQVRESENTNRAWASQGMATIGELLRSHPDNFDLLCDTLLRRLIEYIGVEQGGLYLLDDDHHTTTGEKIYRLKSSFAWGRKRYQEAEVQYGVGLVGACAMEREVLLVTDVPPGYSTIIAGVGEAEPRSLVFLPLIHEEVSLGVIELASFRIVEPHVVEFLHSLSQPIAASIFSVRVGVQTRVLLQEAQEHAEELAARDEELRQNLEELSATQEEAMRRSEESENLIRSLANMLYYVEYDLDGYITDVSHLYLQRIRRPRDLILNTYFAEGLGVPGWTKPHYDAFWHSVRGGFSRRLDIEIYVDGELCRLAEFYIPIQNRQGEVLKIVKLSYEL